MSNIIICPVCGRGVQSLGFASHRAGHYRKRIEFKKKIEQGHIGLATIKKMWGELYFSNPVPETRKEAMRRLTPNSEPD